MQFTKCNPPLEPFSWSEHPRISKHQIYGKLKMKRKPLVLSPQHSPRAPSRAAPRCTSPRGRQVQSPRAPALRGCSACDWRPSSLPVRCTPLHSQNIVPVKQQSHLISCLHAAPHAFRIAFRSRPLSGLPCLRSSDTVVRVKCPGKLEWGACGKVT